MPDSEISFFEAAEKGGIAVLKQSLQDGTDINAVNRQGRTAILLAAMNKRYEAVQFLIDSGADINRQDQTCFNPFLWGCLNDDLTLVKLMIKAGADLTLMTRFGGVGITPAAEKGHVDIVRELLETTDINYNHTNFVGWTPLLEAIVLNDGGARQQEIVRLLLKHGANPDMTDKYGKTPLTLAKEKGYQQIADLLVAGGAS
ncbi:MAG: Ankyrin repeat protein [Candidatus Tokpelaia hoelldobleri]|uniref:Ankyrin repeat protein n=1 Tax=Candidatus Tokpelaia hoelldobleri TaxID=1902579 RepID=A0A1U9JV06_9HYPH|nr:MAG: Ankyrin repeat protein [Candidatus Tokpelaia hoelldoblerii]